MWGESQELLPGRDEAFLADRVGGHSRFSQSYPLLPDTEGISLEMLVSPEVEKVEADRIKLTKWLWSPCGTIWFIVRWWRGSRTGEKNEMIKNWLPSFEIPSSGFRSKLAAFAKVIIGPTLFMLFSVVMTTLMGSVQATLTSFSILRLFWKHSSPFLT